MKFQILMLIFLIMSCIASDNSQIKTRIKIKNMLCVLIRLEINCDRDVGAGAVDGVVDDKEDEQPPEEDTRNEDAEYEDQTEQPPTNYVINKNKQQSRIFLSGSLSERDINLIKFSLKNKVVFT